MTLGGNEVDDSRDFNNAETPLTEAQNKLLRMNDIKAKIDKTSWNSKYLLGRDRNHQSYNNRMHPRWSPEIGKNEWGIISFGN